METIFSGLDSPTAMAFLGLDDILVIEKNTGKVQRIQNGEISEEPLLDLDVASQFEQGLLGIATSKNSSNHKTYVFLYYTEAERETGGDRGVALGNRLYRYELSEDGRNLVSPRLLLDLPYEPGPAHNGGTIAIRNEDVCVVIGNLVAFTFNNSTGNSLAQNVRNGEEPDGRAGIICVTQNGDTINYNYSTEDGSPKGGGILGDSHPLDKYYAYGIRNSFGITFDPLTGNLWDTENGGFDEINLVEPGFNSGFSRITGSSINNHNDGKFDEGELVDFSGKGKYSDPKLDLGEHVVPTAIVFLDSDSLGEEYENDLFVATYSSRIFHFDLNENRTQLILEGELADKIADTHEELEKVTFAYPMGAVTDLKVGPDGYLYAVNFGNIWAGVYGDIVRIVPKTNLDRS